MRRYKQRRHPLKHILLGSFLFNSPNELDALYSAVREEFEVGGVEALQMSIRWEWIERLRHLVEDDSMSVCRAASVIGIPMNVAVRAAKQCQIKYQHRPHVEDTTLGDAIREMLIEGLSREQILERSGIKRTLLKDIMARSTDLREAWRTMDFERRRTEHRNNFLKLLNRYRGLSLKKIRMIPGNGVSWLYRKDREWYKEHLPKANGL